MKPKLPPPAWWAAFLSLCLVATELHEQVHIQTGYLLFGAYGPRDFNRWQTAGSGPESVWASAAGPLFSYSLAWAGTLLLRRGGKKAGWGIALVFAALPGAHILTSCVGSGDERVVLDHFMDARSAAGRSLLAAWSLLVYGVPVAAAVRALPAGRRIALLVLLLLAPILVEFGLLHRLYNSLLERGWGATVPFGGTPLLVQAHLLSVLIFCWMMRRAISCRWPGQPLPRASSF
ncbi:hypothetical protein EPD60_13755 [Flaviaesturariibacter flavus]|uniref:Uncharacterized protein n=1 Tax=Flaviaesturariibacter flavus TaxID=2502780 RepID=A0A4R1B949_9BACT|nr:hypothetical protein [Flaviaesturariibacter flavus]TCJ13129.1 hypothetical protein EPD60_13755 [Flaviaesturariibacter flavus]